MNDWSRTGWRFVAIFLAGEDAEEKGQGTTFGRHSSLKLRWCRKSSKRNEESRIYYEASRFFI